VRLRNLADLELPVTLLESSGRHRVSFPAEQVKTRKPLEVDWPIALEPALRQYLDEYRPRLLRNNESGFLWLTARGTPLLTPGIFTAITRRTRAGLGVSVNPHLFRDCAATMVAIEDPEHVGIAKCLLGHASSATTDKYYNQACSMSANRVYQEILDKQRDMLEPRTVARRRLSRPPAAARPKTAVQGQLQFAFEPATEAMKRSE
jgi:integrase